MLRGPDPALRSDLIDLETEFPELLSGDLKLEPGHESALQRCLHRVLQDGTETTTDFSSAIG